MRICANAAVPAPQHFHETRPYYMPPRFRSLSQPLRDLNCYPHQVRTH